VVVLGAGDGFVSVRGSSGDDYLRFGGLTAIFEPENGPTLTLKNYERFSFSGRGGNDRGEIKGLPSESNFFEGSQAVVELTSSINEIRVFDFDHIDAQAGPNDTALVQSFTKYDTTVIRRDEFEMSGEDWSFRGIDFVNAELIGDGTREAVIMSDFEAVDDGASFTLTDPDQQYLLNSFASVLFDGGAVPDIAGTGGDDTFSISYRSTPAVFKVNNVQSRIRSTGGARFDGLDGDDRVTVIGPASGLTTLRFRQVDARGEAFIWADIESVQATRESSAVVELVGTVGVDLFKFGGLSAVLEPWIGPSLTVRDYGTIKVRDDVSQGGNDIAELKGLNGDTVRFTGNANVSRLVSPDRTIEVRDFDEINVTGTGANDVAYLSGDAEGGNEFVGNSSFGHMTTPSGVITATGFDLVGATAGGAGDSASLTGTSRDEELYSNLGTVRMVSSNFILNASGFDNVVGTSGGGSDFVNFNDSSGDDTIFSQPGQARMDYDGGKSVTATNFETVRSVSTGGNDVARFTGTTGNEKFLGSQRFGRLQGSGFVMTAVSYPEVVVEGNGGSDEAFLNDSSGDEFFFASPELSYISGTGFKLTVEDFSRVFGLMTSGNDTAEFNGSSSDEVFWASPLATNMTGEDFFFYGRNFDSVVANGGGGEDRATLRDSGGNDAFFADPSSAWLRNENFHNEVRDFAIVKAISSGGQDVASFEGSSSGVDTFTGLRGFSVLEGDGFRNQVNGFRQVTVEGISGTDNATLYDSDEDDVFVGQGNRGFLEGESYRIELFDYDLIEVFGFNGGNNQLGVGNVNFQWNQFGNWN